jgi:molecular chaperone DnaK (HSP70)
MNQGILLGVDFGTHQSSIGFMRRTGPQILPTARGSYSIPSVLTWDDGFITGDAAKGYSARSAMSVISDLTRLVGRRFDDPNIQHWKTFWPFPIKADDQGQIKISITQNGSVHEYSPADLI